jgi:hypothetical protein
LNFRIDVIESDITVGHAFTRKLKSLNTNQLCL